MNRNIEKNLREIFLTYSDILNIFLDTGKGISREDIETARREIRKLLTENCDEYYFYKFDMHEFGNLYVDFLKFIIMDKGVIAKFKYKGIDFKEQTKIGSFLEGLVRLEFYPPPRLKYESIYGNIEYDSKHLSEEYFVSGKMRVRMHSNEMEPNKLGSVYIEKSHLGTGVVNNIINHFLIN